MKKPKTNKGKQWIQDKEVLLYKPYEVELPRPKSSKPMFIQDKIDNLDKYMKFMQAPIKMIPFYSPPYYKFLWPQENKISNTRMKLLLNS